VSQVFFWWKKGPVAGSKRKSFVPHPTNELLTAVITRIATYYAWTPNNFLIKIAHKLTPAKYGIRYIFTTLFCSQNRERTISTTGAGRTFARHLYTLLGPPLYTPLHLLARLRVRLHIWLLTLSPSSCAKDLASSSQHSFGSQESRRDCVLQPLQVPWESLYLIWTPLSL
jgi:hypothetical protein